MLLKRQSGTLRLTHLLVVVLIANAAQHGLSNEYRTITEGLVLVATILGWSYSLDWLGYWFPRMQRFIHLPVLPLVRDGRLLHRNVRRELVTEAGYEVFRVTGASGTFNMVVRETAGTRMANISALWSRGDQDLQLCKWCTMSSRSAADLVQPFQAPMKSLFSGWLAGITIVWWTRPPESVDAAVAVRLAAPP